MICAYCMCMAGLGEVCSHISALLFAVETNTHMQSNLSCTSRLCSWLPHEQLVLSMHVLLILISLALSRSDKNCWALMTR